MDALVFRGQPLEYQFRPDALQREINKAYVTFCAMESGNIVAPQENPEPVATGNWGCGAFGGDRELKAMIQWIAASESGRAMLYFTFKDKFLSEPLQNIANALLSANVTVGTLYRAILGMNSQNSNWDTFTFLNSYFNLGLSVPPRPEK